jgi:hypothetical protein
MSGQFVIRPDSGGLVELELFRPDDMAEDAEPSIMLGVTPNAPETVHFALSPATARRFALGILEQVDAYERWQAENGGAT